MRYLSLFSGIEAATVAWHPLGWEPVAFAEVEPLPCALLAHRYPHVPNFGDVTAITETKIKELGRIDFVVFGFPCQDLSIAGKRAGLKGERSGLFFDAMRIVRWSGARFALLENVPGLFSSNDGRDFAAVVGAMAGMECNVPDNGWRNTGVALGRDALVEWCVLDAQWFGVPQRRRRVFALRDIGDWRNRPPLLFDAESLRGYPAPSQKARQRIAPTISARTKGGGGLGTDFDLGGNSAGSATNQVSHTLNAKGACGRYDYESETLIAHSLRAEGFDASEDGTGRGVPLVCGPLTSSDGGIDIDRAASNQLVAFSCKDYGADAGDIAPTIRSMGHDGSHANAGGQIAIAVFDPRNVTSKANRTRCEVGMLANTLHKKGLSIIGSGVRRLTPRECDRLQGFPDDYTLIPYRGKPVADGPRYKALGNSFAVPVMRWIGERIQAALYAGGRDA